MEWLYGSSASPQGQFDKICYNTWLNGNFCKEYKTTAALVDATKASPQLVGEFSAARKEMICILQDGKKKLRGRERDKMLERLRSARVRYVDLVQAVTSELSEDFSAMTRAAYERQYKATHI